MHKKFFCFEYNKYFDGLENQKKEYDDKISYQVMNINQNYILINNALDYFAKPFSDNKKIINVINKKNIEIKKLLLN